MGWTYIIFPKKKKFKILQSTGKLLLTAVWDIKGAIYDEPNVSVDLATVWRSSDVLL
jgi:hypothetical protein